MPPLIFNRCPNGIAEEKAEIIDFHIELANERRVFDTESDLAASSMVSCECAATPAMPNTWSHSVANAAASVPAVGHDVWPMLVVIAGRKRPELHSCPSLVVWERQELAGSTRLLFPSATMVQVIGNGKHLPQTGRLAAAGDDPFRSLSIW
jgi:hypothetical protein